MKSSLESIYEQSVHHQREHLCGGYPYQHMDVLVTLIRAIGAKHILELGTGIGYSAAAMAISDPTLVIDTIDQDASHLEIAHSNWQNLKVTSQITSHLGKAEAILPTLSDGYDLIFFDGHTPSMKFLMQFEKLLKKGGVLVTANMFIRDNSGGKYMRALQKEYKWQIGVFDDTAVAVKLFDS